MQQTPLPTDLPAQSHKAQSLEQLLLAEEQQKRLPIISLSLALQQMKFMDAVTLDALHEEDPDLLKSRSGELVGRFYLSTEELNHALARVAAVAEIDILQFDTSADAFEVLVMREARAHEVVPLGHVDDVFFIASWMPTNQQLYLDLCSYTSRNVRLVWASREDIQKRLDLQQHAYTGPRNLNLVPPADQPQKPVGHAQAHDSGPQDMDDLMSLALIEISASPQTEYSTTLNESSGMVLMVKKMIDEAFVQGASDIHVETNPQEQRTLIRFRIDGELKPYVQLPARLRAALISRIKIMAHMDISEHRRPQDGKIEFPLSNSKTLELRVVAMPTHSGLEDIVMRLLASSKPIPLAKLGLQTRDAATVARMSARSFGLIIAAGPTGSGKTTTLHSMLAELNSDERKIWTAEDPIEITQPGLRQVQVNPKIGFTFAAAMRSFLRADPDVIMIGEIRDEETAKIAIEASLTGHLVLSTLHTNNACESVVRLLDLGMDTINFSDSLIGVVAQRLVRSLCTHCAEPHSPSTHDFGSLVAEYIAHTSLTEDEGKARLLAAAGVDSLERVVVYRAKGCPKCGDKGYKGRIGVYEILENNPLIRKLIRQNASPQQLFEASVSAGMRSLRHDALEKLVQGKLDVVQARAAYM